MQIKKVTSIISVVAISATGMVAATGAVNATEKPVNVNIIKQRVKPGESKTQNPADIAKKKKAATINTLVTNDKGELSLVKTRTENRKDTLNTIATMQQNPNSVAVGVDREIKLVDTLENKKVETKNQVTAKAANDQWYSLQWAASALNYDTLSTQTTGTGRKVAVVDTGVDTAHPDLTGNLLPGASFVAGSSAATDGNGHGTHIAGIIGAKRNNSIGIAGMMPTTKVVPVKVLDANGTGTVANVVNGIVWAAGQNVDAINLSLGMLGHDDVLHTAVQYANNRGVLVVVAGGNERTEGSPIEYPAAYNEVLAVSATNWLDGIAWFSNSNNYIDVAAPGDEVISTIPVSPYNSNSYDYKSGTSMAAPHVAALAAGLRQLKPDLTVGQLKTIITTTATDKGAAGIDNDYGHGFINPGAAVTLANNTVTTPRTIPPTPTIYPTNTTVTLDTPVLTRVGQVTRVYVNVRRNDNGAGIGGVKVELLVDVNEGKDGHDDRVLYTASNGVAYADFSVTRPLTFYASSSPVVGSSYGSDHVTGVRPVFKAVTSARIKKKKLALTLGDRTNRSVRVERKKKKKWVTFRRSTVANANKVKITTKGTYRVFVAGYSMMPSGYSNTFKKK